MMIRTRATVRTIPRLVSGLASSRRQHVAPAAAAEDVTGIVFHPFNEVKDTLVGVEQAPDSQSFGRCDFHANCESALNEQINVEYTNSLVYHAAHAYFNRDNVGLPGFAAYFLKESHEERTHAQLLMDYQNQRGGRVKLQALAPPDSEIFGQHEEKGDALFAMELALSLEKLNFQKLCALHSVGEECGDAPMTHYIEDFLLQDQVEDIKEYAEFVSQLRRVGKGLGVYEFDKMLASKAGEA